MTTPGRPPFIVSIKDVREEEGRYSGSDEGLSFGRPIGKAAGMTRIGIHYERVPPGRRTSYPHAESDEEEFVYVIEGNVDAWIDGEVHPLTAGDFVAFPPGTGIAHTFINNSTREAILLVGGEKSKPNNRISYPLNPEEKAKRGERYWHDAPKRPLGPHKGRADERK